MKRQIYTSILLAITTLLLFNNQAAGISCLRPMAFGQKNDSTHSADAADKHPGQERAPYSKTNKMRLMVTEMVTDKNDAMSQQATFMILADYKKAIREKGSFSLGLSTGSTPIGTYKLLVQFAEEGLMDFNKIITFNMDEYKGLDPKYIGNMTLENPGDPNISYRAFMYHYLFKPLFDKRLMTQENINKNVHIFESNPKDAYKLVRDYEKKIDRFGIDTWLSGLGKNGHIAFNEPAEVVYDKNGAAIGYIGTDKRSKSRKVWLSKETREANSRYFEFNNHEDDTAGRRWVVDEGGTLKFVDPDTPGARQITHEEAVELVPREAFTTGIATFRKAKHHIIIASGEGKAEAVQYGMDKPPHNNNALSLLQDCKNCDVIIDTEAASLLEKKPTPDSIVRAKGPKELLSIFSTIAMRDSQDFSEPLQRSLTYSQI